MTALKVASPNSRDFCLPLLPPFNYHRNRDAMKAPNYNSRHTAVTRAKAEPINNFFSYYRRGQRRAKNVNDLHANSVCSVRSLGKQKFCARVGKLSGSIIAVTRNASKTTGALAFHRTSGWQTSHDSGKFLIIFFHFAPELNYVIFESFAVRNMTPRK